MKENKCPCEYLETGIDLGTMPDEKQLYYVGITLNYSPKFKFTCIINKRKRIIGWGQLTPDQQKCIFVNHLKDIYAIHFVNLVYSFELTKDGNLHCHAIGCFVGDKDQSQYELTMIRKSVSQHPEVRRYTGSNYRYTITSNYIHYVEKDVWLNYITKELKNTPYKLNLITNYNSQYANNI